MVITGLRAIPGHGPRAGLGEGEGIPGPVPTAIRTMVLVKYWFPGSQTAVADPRRPDAVDSSRTPERGYPPGLLRTHPDMRSPSLVVAFLAILAVAGCASAKPGWTYAPPPSASPISSGEPSASPSVDPSASASAAPSPAPSASAGPSTSASASPAGTVLEIIAEGVAFDRAELAAPADQPFQIHFTNNDPSDAHNIAIREGPAPAPEVFKGETFKGVDERTYDVTALAAGTYRFVCTIHPIMAGTLTVG